MRHKFKIGDRVRATTDFGRVKKGFTGTVIENDSLPCVAWDNEEVEGYGVCGYRNVWAVREDWLELLDINQNKIMLPDKHLFSGPVTILFWPDGQKNLVRKTEDEADDRLLAFLTAYFQKTSGLSRNQANEYLEEVRREEEEFRKQQRSEEVRKREEELITLQPCQEELLVKGFASLGKEL